MSIHVIFYITISCNVGIKLLLLVLFYYYTIKSPEPTNQYNTSEYLSIGYLLFKQQFHISSINTLNCFYFFYIYSKKCDLLLLKIISIRICAFMLSFSNLFFCCCCRHPYMADNIFYIGMKIHN